MHPFFRHDLCRAGTREAAQAKERARCVRRVTRLRGEFIRYPLSHNWVSLGALV